MMAPDPLRSATTLEGAEDTSLALPSDRNLSSGKQRVLDQVHSIKRAKSKRGKSDSTSPTSPSTKPFSTYNEFGTFKFMSSKGNDLLSRANSTMSTSYNKMQNFQKIRSQSTRVPQGRHVSSSTTWDQQTDGTVNKPNGLKTSRSDPTLASPFSPAQLHTRSLKGQNTIRVLQQSTSSMVNGPYMTNSQTRIFQLPQHQSDGKMGTIKMSNMEHTSMLNSAIRISDITIEEAVEYLSHSEVDHQQFGACAIQHFTFTDQDVKDKVNALGGISALVNLLDSPNPQVSQSAAGALRNLVFQNKPNKLEVYECGGIAKALNLLKNAESIETKKQITGLLWNLSSEDELKQNLLYTALPALTGCVVAPYAANDSDRHFVDSTVFYNATGCLRNLSCGGVQERNMMRNCHNLISSLLKFIESCASKETIDDTSVENCVCILQNATFQLGKECPDAFKESSEVIVPSVKKKNATFGLFSPRSSKSSSDKPTEKDAICHIGEESDVKMLCQRKAIENYLSLLEFSKQKCIREASCGALQNLTSSSKNSEAVCKILLEKLPTSPILASLIESNSATIRKTAFSLLNNMSRSRVNVDMAKLMFCDLVGYLDVNTKDSHITDEEAVILSDTLLRLMLSDSEVTKKLVDKNVVATLMRVIDTRVDSYPKGTDAASVLLYNMWHDKNLYSAVRKMGFSKNCFINRKSTEAFEASFRFKDN